MTEDKRWGWHRIGMIKTPWINLFTLIVLALPLFHPFGLPFAISPEARSFYDEVEKLKPRSVVWVAWDMEPSSGTFIEVRSGTIAIISHLFRQDLRIFFVSFTYPASVEAMNSLILPMVETRGKQYGVDYVNIGWVPGGETGVATFAKDVRSAVANDYRGTSLDKLPIMSDVRNIKDVQLIILFASASVGMFIRQWWSLEKTTTLGVCDAAQYTLYMTYMSAGQLRGVVNAVNGGAQYERLINRPGDGIKMLDQINIGYLFTLGLIALRNIGVAGERLTKRKESEEK